jgi:hypothetical protein
MAFFVHKIRQDLRLIAGTILHRPLAGKAAKELNMPLSLLVLLYLTTLTYPGPAVNGVKIVTRQVTGGFTDTRTEYITTNRFRNEWETRTGDHSGPDMASIVQRGDRDRVFVLDLRSKEYVTYETDSRGTAFGRKATATESSGGTLQISIQNIDTGERKEIFGHNARHIITRETRVASRGACSKGSESETDGWYIDDTVLPEWRQSKKNSMGVVVASVVSVDGRNDCQNKMDKIEVHRTGAEVGFPLKSNTKLKSEVAERDGTPRMLSSSWGSEVVELREGPLDPALFEVPPDFRQVESLKNWSTTTPRRQLSGWEWFKDKVQEIFR